MSKHLYVKQTTLDNTIENNVQSTVIKKIYDIIIDNERLGNVIDNLSAFIGEINTGYTYKKYKDKIEEIFQGLKINPLGLYVYFEDKKVEQILIDNYAPEEGGILESQIFSNGNYTVNYGFRKNNINLFKDNTDIETFDELNQLLYVKKLHDSTFKNCTNLKSINLSNLTQIESSAFYGCTSLAIDINIPNLSLIGTDAFAYSGITSISNLGITNTLSNVFHNCSSLISADLSPIQILSGGTFNTCSNLSTIINTSNIVQIGNYAFNNCISLTSFTFNENITIIGENTFSGCTSLIIDDLNLPNLTSLGQSAFRDTKLKKVSNLGNITEINRETFRKCSMLTSVTLPNTLIKINEYAFYECSLLTSVTLPESLTSIGSNVFIGCTNLQTVTVDWSKIKKISDNIFKGCTNLGIGETVDLNLTEQTSYPSGAFGYTKYKKLIIHMQLGEWNGIIGNYDSRYPLQEGMEQLEYLDYSDSNIINWASLYLSNDSNGRMNTMVWPAAITKVDWRWHMYMPNLQYFIILVENPSQMDITGSGAGYLNGGEAGRIPLTCNIYVKDSTVRDRYLAHEFWGTIPNASTRIKTLAELPTGVWTTGLYQQYEPYLSNH